MERTQHLAIEGRFEAGLAARLRGWLGKLTVAGFGRESLLRIEARLSLGPKKSLVLVDCCGKRMLLAISGDSIHELTEIGAAGQPARSRRPRKNEAIQ